MIKTEKLWISSTVRRAWDAGEMVDEFAGEAGLSEKERQYLQLLTEETVGMVQAMEMAFEGEIWIEGDEKGYAVLLEADTREKEESPAAQACPEGFMAKIAEMLNCSYAFDDISEVPDHLADTLPDYMSYGMAEDRKGPVWAGKWSLTAYRETLEEKRKDPKSEGVLDELEKSIVAQIADEVTVGITGKKIRLEIARKTSR